MSPISHGDLVFRVKTPKLDLNIPFRMKILWYIYASIGKPGESIYGTCLVSESLHPPNRTLAHPQPPTHPGTHARTHARTHPLSQPAGQPASHPTNLQRGDGIQPRSIKLSSPRNLPGITKSPSSSPSSASTKVISPFQPGIFNPQSVSLYP